MRATGPAVAPMALAAANEIALGYHLTLEVMRGSYGDHYHLGSLAQLVYTVALLDQMGSKRARVEELQEAKDAIRLGRQAAVSTGTWSLDENGYQAIRKIVTLFNSTCAAAGVPESGVHPMSLHNRVDNFASVQQSLVCHVETLTVIFS
jgi:hypothetical protein